ncbi:DUF559 domain-containing protein [Phenylobacterium aquaticum]|nr:DUF559 domain-containing protein [Phenylobacterium aquaticum]
MRQSPTAQEARLWKVLRDRRLLGVKFRRQAPLGPYVVDFLCPRHRLIIEADGPFHQDDSIRDSWLSAQGFTVLRFSNDQIAASRAEVLGMICAWIEAKAPLKRWDEDFPSPLAGEGVGEADG